MLPKGKQYSMDEWAAITKNARYVSSHRDRLYLKGLFDDERFQMEDLASALNDLGILEELILKTKAGFAIYFARVQELATTLERNDYGIEFALYLHFELHLPLKKILQITQVACKTYRRVTDNYEPKMLLAHRYRKSEGVKVPRLAPPISKLVPVIEAIKSELGVEAGDNGRLALRSVAVVFQEMAARAPGKHGMPPLPSFMGGALNFPIVVSFDGTGFRNLSINTIAVRTPFSPQTAASNYIIGIGKVKDDKAGTSALLGPNLETINNWIINEKNGVCTDVEAPTNL